jgi:molecular chaperone DnaJ
VLSNSERRELYDRFGHAGLRSGGFEPSAFDLGSLSDLFSAFFGDDLFGMGGRMGRSRGADIAARVEIDLAEVATGTKCEVPFGVAVPCDRCAGSGAEPDTPVTTCPTGAGKLIEQPCEKCSGSGRVLEERTVEVEIPSGIHDGQRIRLTGEGHAGSAGARAGDVYVEVHVRPDERFVREGNDVYTTVDLTITQAALGATVTVPTLAGDTEMTFDPGTQPGEIVVLRGRGLPVLQGFGRGNQRVLVNVTVPRRLTEEQRQLLEEFERLAGAETYEPGEGFFDKLKSAFR